MSNEELVNTTVVCRTVSGIGKWPIQVPICRNAQGSFAVVNAMQDRTLVWSSLAWAMAWHDRAAYLQADEELGGKKRK